MAHRQRGVPQIVTWPDHKQRGRIDISREVVSLKAAKALDQPAGNWQMTVIPRQSDSNQSKADIRRLAKLYHSTELNSVMSIGFDSPGGIMLGLVDRVSITRSMVGETVMQGLSLSGSDFGKTLAVDNIVLASLAVPGLREFIRRIEVTLGPDHPLVVALPGCWGPPEDLGLPLVGPDEPSRGNRSRAAVPTFIGQPVETVVEWVLANAASIRIPLMAEVTGGTGKVSDFISTDFSITTWNDSRVFNDAMHTNVGSIWAFIMKVLDRDFYEATLQTVPNGSALANLELVIRPKPFDSDLLAFAEVSESTGNTWESLRTLVKQREYHDIAFDEVFQEDIGVSDSGSLSYYMVTAKHELIGNPSALSEGLMYPLVDTFNAKKFGIRQYNSSLQLVNGDIRKKARGDTDYDGEVAAEVREFRNRLFNWYRLNPYFATGSMTVAGRDEFRPGDKINASWAIPKIGTETGMQFYCPSVTWNWQYGGNYTSTLQLTRGQSPSMILAAKNLIGNDAPFENPDHYAES